MEMVSHQFCIYFFPSSAGDVVAVQLHPSEPIFGLIKRETSPLSAPPCQMFAFSLGLFIAQPQFWWQLNKSRLFTCRTAIKNNLPRIYKTCDELYRCAVSYATGVEHDSDLVTWRQDPNFKNKSNKGWKKYEKHVRIELRGDFVQQSGDRNKRE